MDCVECGHRNDSSPEYIIKAFCEKCGSQISKACPLCYGRQSVGAEFCATNGKRISTELAEKKQWEEFSPKLAKSVRENFPFSRNDLILFLSPLSVSWLALFSWLGAFVGFTVILIAVLLYVGSRREKVRDARSLEMERIFKLQGFKSYSRTLADLWYEANYSESSS